jgi:hypothetical protein
VNVDHDAPMLVAVAGAAFVGSIVGGFSLI